MKQSHLLLFLGISLYNIPSKLLAERNNYPSFQEALSLITEISFKYPELLQEKNWNIAFTLYTNTITNLQWSQQPKIPKIIHQIWLGSPLPDKCRKLQNSWRKLHPSWEMRLWTEKEINEFNLTNKVAYDMAHNYGEKSDIARYEILYRLGGLYIDTDFECLKPFDELHHCLDFYTGIAFDAQLVLFNGLIASCPNHKILKTCIDRIGQRKHNNNAPHEIMDRTGPYFFTRCVFESINNLNEPIVLFPPSFFYPWTGWHKTENPYSFIKYNSFSLHHAHGSWMQ